MARVKFKPGELRGYLQNVRNESGLSWGKLSQLCSVSLRTLNDWKREKYNPNLQALENLSSKFNISLPKAEVLSDYWYVDKGASLGGHKRYKLYGPPGSIEDRRKGGVISQLRRKEDPEKYRKLGCKVRKNFKRLVYSEKLAELVGILMGDGELNKFQIKVTLDQKVDRDYATYVSGLMEEVIGEKPSWTEYDGNVIRLIVSGINLVDALERVGLKRGNKVDHQIDFPKWIWKNGKFQKACARGLFDTDGGVYFHFHTVNGLKYRNFGACFTNHSIPLVDSFFRVLTKYKIKAKRSNIYKVYIYDLNEVVKYMNVIGSNNSKNIEKLNYHNGHSKKI